MKFLLSLTSYFKSFIALRKQNSLRTSGLGCLLPIAYCLFVTAASAQPQDTTLRYKVAVFAPLYLDSAFDENDEYRYSKNVFPKFLNPGLEFYQGVQLALDSLNKAKAALEVFVFDTKSERESLDDQLDDAIKNGVQLIIAHSSSAEIKEFANAGLKKNVPVVNVNLPNDGGTSSNPYFVILNPTLRTQCEGIYRFVQKNYSLNPIVVFRKKGSLEDRIKTYFQDYSKSTMSVPLKLKYVDLTDTFSLSQVRAHLDTAEQTLCIAGSLDESFGKRLVQSLATLKKQDYESVVVGMPTWDNITFNKPEFKGIEIIYSTPFYHPKVDRVSQSINTHFNKVMYSRPSDMVFRGYEVMMRFGKLLNQYGRDLASNLSRRQSRIFTDYDIQPVLSKPSMTLEYFENKKLYFLKYENGALKGVY